ncbi:MAG: hypothetical protein K2K28_01735, partial [Clostridia bacterium]|nr:hypothetical protein [Clostridia bacterium]
MRNEAYGTPWKEYYYSGTGSVNTGYGGNGVNIKVGYGDWADDYLWLPSISEIYKDKNSGVWGLSDEQRATEENVWLRTGNHSNAGEVITLNSYGIINSQTCNEYLVRPALHLDLTEAEQAAQLPEPEVEVVFDIKSTLYTCDGLPQPTSCTANYGGANVEGKFVWDEQPIVSGTNIYKWTFVPADKGFCEVHGEQELHFEALTVVGIQASLNSDSKIYACTTEDEFRSCVTVIVNYVNGKTVETEEYEIENFALTVGVVNKLIITYSSPDGSFSAELAVEEVEEVEATDIIVEFDGSDGFELYPDSDINCLKPYIAVKVKWNYKEDYETVQAEDCTLKANGKLEVGEAEIFVVYAGLEKLIEPKPTVNKGTYDMSGVKLVGEYEVVY